MMGLKKCFLIVLIDCGILCMGSPISQDITGVADTMGEVLTGQQMNDRDDSSFEQALAQFGSFTDSINPSIIMQILAQQQAEQDESVGENSMVTRLPEIEQDHSPTNYDSEKESETESLTTESTTNTDNSVTRQRSGWSSFASALPYGLFNMANFLPRREPSERTAGLHSPSIFSILQSVSTSAKTQRAIHNYANSLIKTYGLSKSQSDVLANSFAAAVAGLKMASISENYGKVITESFNKKMANFEQISSDTNSNIMRAVSEISSELILPQSSQKIETRRKSKDRGNKFATSILNTIDFMKMLNAPSTVAPETYAQEIVKSYGLENDNRTRAVTKAFTIFAESVSKNFTTPEFIEEMGTVFNETIKSFGLEPSPIISSEVFPNVVEAFVGILADQRSSKMISFLQPMIATMTSSPSKFSKFLSSPLVSTSTNVLASTTAEEIANKLHLNEYQSEIFKSAFSTIGLAAKMYGDITNYPDILGKGDFRNIIESMGGLGNYAPEAQSV